MAAWECSSSASGCGQPFSTASRSRCSEPTPGLPPQEKTSFSDRAHADQLVVDQVRRHADQRQALAALADHLVPGGEGDEMGEPFHGDRVAVLHMFFDGFGKGQECCHARPFGRTARGNQGRRVTLRQAAT